MIKLFNERWDRVPTVWIDTETTGVRPGVDRAVQIGFARFDAGKYVDAVSSLVNPGIPIPAEATAIHGINDTLVEHSMSIAEVFAVGEVCDLLKDAQPAAYNAPFDRHFVPPFGDDWTWPWLDCLSVVRVVDRYVKGKGRHRLEVTCTRHGVGLKQAHDAAADARAAGELFYRLVPLAQLNPQISLGALLRWQREREAEEWFRFTEWLSRQPPREQAADG